MGRMRFAAVVIESTLAEFLRRPPYARADPQGVIRVLLALSVRFGVPIYFVGSRSMGAATTRTLLEMAWRYHREGGSAAE